MPQSDSAGRSIPWAAVIAVLAATTGALFYFSSLESSRRPTPSEVPLQVLGYQDAEARLWQDPFRAAANRMEELRRSNVSSPSSKDATASRGGVLAGEEGSPDRLHVSSALQEQISAEIEAAGGRKVLVIPVMVPAGPYGELAEGRLRTRVAVLEALAAMGYESRAGDHVGYVRIPWCSSHFRPGVDHHQIFEAHDSRRDGTTLLLPYEWLDHAPVQIAGRRPFSHRSHETYSAVLLVWCAEEAFSDLPLSRLTALINELRPPATAEGASIVNGCVFRAIIKNLSTTTTPTQTVAKPLDDRLVEQKIEFHVLGPSVSTTLRALLEEANCPDPRTVQVLRRVRMYSGTATADDRILLFGLDDTEEDEPDMLGHFVQSHMAVSAPGETVSDAVHDNDSKEGFRLFRLTKSDHEMADALVLELERRGLRLRARLGDNPDQVAVVAELDTFYGRALPFSFAGALTGEDATGLMREPRRFPQWVHPFVYLRGLDGKVPGDPTPTTDEKEKDKAPESLKWGNALKMESPSEPPEGLSQTDYLRRLADQLAELDSSLRAQTGEGLKAVGVLGTDVYDKLLVLRALRDRLPGVIFFTTGLDARYTAREDWSATHNLLIAAPFGLRLHEFYQRAIPPFRDSEQTAIFHTTQVALTPNLPDDRRPYEKENPLLKLGTVRLFEVGRSGIYDLSVDAKNPLTPDATERLHDRDVGGELAGPPATVQPYREDLTEWPRRWVPWLLMSISALLLLILPLWAHHPMTPETIRASVISWWQEPDKTRRVTRRKDLFRRLAQNTTLFLVLTTLLVTGVIVLLVHLEGQEGGPNAWFDRVNVWPTEAIRLFTGLLCMHLIIKSLAARADNDRKIQRAFALDWVPEPTHAGPRPATRRSLAVDSLRPRLRLDQWKVVGDRRRNLVTNPNLKPTTRGTFVYAQNLWWEYQRRGGWRQRFLRAGIMAALFWVFAFALYSRLGSSARPTRGALAQDVDSLFLGFSVLMFLFLTFYVLDAALLNRRFIDHLTTTETFYPRNAFNQFRQLGLPRSDLNEYADIRLIAERTKVVGAVVYYPFMVFFLIVVGRSSLFADWKWPAALVVVLACSLTIAIAATLALRRAAERARADAIRRLRERLVRASAAGDEATARAIQELIALVRGEKEGAFSLLSQHPIIAAILLPSGGIGLWAILEYIAHASGG
jgi:hypothetical protein